MVAILILLVDMRPPITIESLNHSVIKTFPASSIFQFVSTFLAL